MLKFNRLFLTVLLGVSFLTNAQIIPFPNQLPTTPVYQAPRTAPNQVPSQQTRTANANTDGRLIDVNANDQKIQDSTRLAAEQEILADTERNKLRKRIFGYNYFNTGKFDPTPALNIATPNNYVLGPNDQLNIDLYGIYQDRFTPTITPDGYIRIERGGIGLIYVSGLSIEQARDRIVSRLSKAYVGLKGPNPTASATITLGNIRSIKINILGEVVAPGTYTVPSLSTILNALYICGGPNEIGSFRTIQLIRQNRVVANFDFYDVLLNGFSKQNLLLQDQDIIKVPAYNTRVVIEGAVKRNMIFELDEKENLSKLIEYAGGFSPNAFTSRLKLYRNTEREKRIMDVTKDMFNTMAIKTGDSIYVNQLLDRFENRVIINGAVFRPGEYAIKEKQSLTDLLNSAEGLKEDALTGRISIIRTNPDLSQENLAVNLAEILNKRANDIELQREDVITVPSIFDLTEKAVVLIQGAVNNPDAGAGIEFPFVRNMTIEDLIVKAGGLKESAALSKIEVVRRKRNVDPKSESSEISDIFEFTLNPNFSVTRTESKFTLMPFDEVFVRTSPNYAAQVYVEIEGEIVYPGKYGVKRKDEKISDLVIRSGGLSPQAYVEGATLVRKINLSDFELEQRRKNLREINSGISADKQGQTLEVQEVDKTTMDAIGIDLRRILENPGSSDDMILQEGDVLRIPKKLETVRIQGEVLRPITVKFKEGAKFEDYIIMAGGFTEQSLKKSSFVLYANGGVDKTRRVGAINVYPKIEPGSEIVVPTKTNRITPEQRIQRIQVIVTAVTAIVSTTLTLITILRLNDIGNQNPTNPPTNGN